MEAVTGEPIEGDFFEFLRDGSYLCKLLNRLQSGLVAIKFETPTTQKFKAVSACLHNIPYLVYHRQS